MKFENDCTLVAGVDANYIRQLETTFPLWLKFWPRLRSIDWLIFYDGKNPELHDRIMRLVSPFRHYKSLRLQAWLPPATLQYEDQRDLMLAAWTLVPPPLVNTRYWLKMDADAFPTRPIAGSFPLQRWFDGDPAIVGHRWGYTKHRGTKGDWFKILDDWGDSIPMIARNYKRMNLRFPEGSRRVSHSRIASFISFFNTQWTLSLWKAIVLHNGLTIPIPSQDTFLWYCAARMNRKIVRVRMKKHGFTNQASFNRLEKTVKELL